MDNFIVSREEKILSFLKDHIGFENYGNALERGLDRIRPIFAHVLKKIKSKVVIIGGTNGKGETTYFLGEIAKKINLSYALWQSPHVLSIRERITCHGSQLSYDEWDQLIADAWNYLQKNDFKLSYYEFLFFVFLKKIESSPVDILFLEVGMGGRLDAVNLFDADISLITSISRDHQDFLGNTLKEILSEKWGITRAGKVCFSALESNYLRYLLSGWAKEKGVLWSDLFDLHLLQKTDAFPVRNLEIAKKCMETLFPERKDVIERNTPALRSKIFKGRGELLSFNQRQFIFYGSHNLDGVRKLLHLLRSDCYTFKAGEKYCFLISLSARRREEMLGMLSAFVCFSKSSRVKAIYVTNFTHHKAATADVLKEVIAEVHLKHQGKIQFVEDWKKIVLEDHVGKYLVTGSYYFVGKVQEDLDHLLFPSSSL